MDEEDEQLSINTPQGEPYKKMQHKAARIVFGNCNGDQSPYISTKDEKMAVVDGFCVEDGFITAVAEVKARDFTIERLRGEFRDEWLITLDKIEDIKLMSQKLRIPGLGLLYLHPSKVVLLLKITDRFGNYVCKFRTARTKTQATCLGGEANRMNAFVKMTDAELFYE